MRRGIHGLLGGASKDYGSKSAMIYHVRARLREDTAAAFLAKLTDGTIEDQRPDGRELVASMKRAVVSEDGLIEWSELWYCDSPLAHERATVLDSHFDEISTEPIDAHESYSGRAFMDYLRRASSLIRGRRHPFGVRDVHRAFREKIESWNL